MGRKHPKQQQTTSESSSEPSTAFWRAIKEDNADRLEDLIASASPQNAKLWCTAHSKKGESVAVVAIASDAMDALDVLLNTKTIAECRTQTMLAVDVRTGVSGVMEAVRQGNLTSVLEIAFDSAVKDPKTLARDMFVQRDLAGFTALHWAAQMGSVEAIETLLGSTFTFYKDSEVPASETPESSDSPSASPEKAVRLRLNIRDFVDKSAEDNDGRTALQIAAENADVDVVAALLSHYDSAQASGDLWKSLASALSVPRNAEVVQKVIDHMKKTSISPSASSGSEQKSSDERLSAFVSAMQSGDVASQAILCEWFGESLCSELEAEAKALGLSLEPQQYEAEPVEKAEEEMKLSTAPAQAPAPIPVPVRKPKTSHHSGHRSSTKSKAPREQRMLFWAIIVGALAAVALGALVLLTDEDPSVAARRGNLH